MVYKIFSLYDSAVGAYNVPMFLRSRGEAIRSFQAAANEGDSNISKWPDQYTLFEIGTYDDASARVEMYAAPESLGTALQYKDQPKSELPLEAAVRLAKGKAN